jgi:hypothetical protein
MTNALLHNQVKWILTKDLKQMKALPIKFNVEGSTIDVPEEGNVDMERVERTLAWLKEHSAFWNQSDYLDSGESLVEIVNSIQSSEPIIFNLQESDEGKNECGTTFCFAGAALLLHDRMALNNVGERYQHLWPLAADGQFAYDHPLAAQELLGLTDNQVELIFLLVPEKSQCDVDVFIQYVRDIVTGVADSKEHYYEMLYAKHPELDPNNEEYDEDEDEDE